MNWKVWTLLFLCVLTGQGCNNYSEAKAYRAVHKRLAGLETYSCVTQVYVKGNKEPELFKVKQWFCAPDKYRLEVIEPRIMQGKTTIYDGSSLWLYYPYIDQSLLLGNIEPSEDEGLFLGFFLRDMLEMESIHCSLGEWNGTPSVVIELPTPGVNKYRTTQRLIMDRKRVQPIMLEMYDTDGVVTVAMEFIEFQFNPKLDSNLFKGDLPPDDESTESGEKEDFQKSKNDEGTP